MILERKVSRSLFHLNESMFRFLRSIAVLLSSNLLRKHVNTNAFLIFFWCSMHNIMSSLVFTVRVLRAGIVIIRNTGVLVKPLYERLHVIVQDSTLLRFHRSK